MKRSFVGKILLLSFLVLTFSGCALTRPASLTVEGDVLRISSSPLIWQKQRGPLFSSWGEAKDYVQDLEIGGYSDWRLPTSEELLDFYYVFDFGEANAKDLGIMIEGNYWLADENGLGFSGSLRDGDICEIDRNFKPASRGYVRAVRP